MINHCLAKGRGKPFLVVEEDTDWEKDIALEEMWNSNAKGNDDHSLTMQSGYQMLWSTKR